MFSPATHVTHVVARLGHLLSLRDGLLFVDVARLFRVGLFRAGLCLAVLLRDGLAEGFFRVGLLLVDLAVLLRDGLADGLLRDELAEGLLRPRDVLAFVCSVKRWIHSSEERKGCDRDRTQIQTDDLLKSSISRCNCSHSLVFFLSISEEDREEETRQ